MDPLLAVVLIILTGLMVWLFGLPYIVLAGVIVVVFIALLIPQLR